MSLRINLRSIRIGGEETAIRLSITPLSWHRRPVKRNTRQGLAILPKMRRVSVVALAILLQNIVINSRICLLLKRNMQSLLLEVAVWVMHMKNTSPREKWELLRISLYLLKNSLHICFMSRNSTPPKTISTRTNLQRLLKDTKRSLLHILRDSTTTFGKFQLTYLSSLPIRHGLRGTAFNCMSSITKSNTATWDSIRIQFLCLKAKQKYSPSI